MITIKTQILINSFQLLAVCF